MIQIGKFRIGFAPFSMVVVFIVLTIAAVTCAIRATRPDYPVPLLDNILIYETAALFVTIIYGIILHLTYAIISSIRRRSGEK